MDTTETYIKMRLMSKELLNHELESGDWVYYEGESFPIVDGGCVWGRDQWISGYQQGWECEDHVDSIMGDDDFIWLPSQGQLQDMVCNDMGLQTICSLTEEFSKSEFAHGITISGSMEQLWLAFVMKEKFNKVWDGEKWL